MWINSTWINDFQKKKLQIFIHVSFANNELDVLPMYSLQCIAISHLFIMAKWLWLYPRNLRVVDDQLHLGHQNATCVVALPIYCPHAYPHGFFMLQLVIAVILYFQVFKIYSTKRGHLDLTQQQSTSHSCRIYSHLICVLQAMHMQLLDFQVGPTCIQHPQHFQHALEASI